MAKDITLINIPLDTDIKIQAEVLFKELGIDLNTAFTIFVRQCIREGGIPFQIKLNTPNKTTVAAMLEAESISKDPCVKGYDNLD